MQYLIDYRQCNIIVFTNKDDAKEVEYWDIKYRGDDSLWRTACHDNILIDTSDESLHDIIGLKFK